MHCNKSLLSKRETVCLFNQLFVQVMENMEKLHIDNKQAAKLNKERFMVAIFFFKKMHIFRMQLITKSEYTKSGEII